MYRGDYKWSRLVGAWVGRGDYAARGVPDWFLDPSKEVKAEPVSAPVEEAVDMKGEEEDKTEKNKTEKDKAAEEKAGEEPRLVEPFDGVQGSEAAAPPAPQTANT